MATSLTLTKATPYSLTYQLDGDNGAGAQYAATILIGHCVPGPLRALLVKYNAANKLDHLNLNAAGPGLESRGLVRIRSVDGIAGAQTPPASKTITWGTNTLDVTAFAGSTSQIEIRLANSIER
jgi:hypothetical protein